MRSSREEVAARVREGRLIAILRRVPEDCLEDVGALLAEAGVLLAEVTWDSPGAAALLRRAADVTGCRVVWGAGTVTTESQVAEAAAAGAAFIVSPALVPGVVEATLRAGLFSVPGVLTPSEVLAAHELGADLMKVFPAGSLGPQYFAELRGPFPDIPLAATGGVTLANASAFLAAGAQAVGVGGALLPRDLIARRDWVGLLARAKALVEAVRG